MYTDLEAIKNLEAIWRNGDDVPVFHDEETGVLYLDADWPDLDGEPAFYKGDEVEIDVWQWFDMRHPGGIIYLMYGDTAVLRDRLDSLPDESVYYFQEQARGLLRKETA